MRRERFSTDTSSKARADDVKFDTIVGHLEDILISNFISYLVFNCRFGVSTVAGWIHGGKLRDL